MAFALSAPLFGASSCGALWALGGGVTTTQQHETHVERFDVEKGRWVPAGELSFVWRVGRLRDGRVFALTSVEMEEELDPKVPRSYAVFDGHAAWHDEQGIVDGPFRATLPAPFADKTNWKWLGGRELLAVESLRAAPSCRLALAAEKLTALPPLSPCFSVWSAARLPSGAIVLAGVATDVVHLVRLDAGAERWLELPRPPTTAIPSELSFTANGRLAVMDAFGAVHVFDGGAWRTLPPVEHARVGGHFALLDDGGALVAGGSPKSPHPTLQFDRLALMLGPWALLAVLVVILRRAAVRGGAIAIGLGLAALAVAGGVALFLALLAPALAWH